MKKVFISLLISVSLYTVHAQKNSTTPVVARYMLFTGTIDKYPVTFHLYQINNEFSGCYYYNSTEEPIDIAGTMDKDHFLKITHDSGEGDVMETLEGSFKDSSFSGTWSSKGKLLPFRITRKKDTSSLAFDYIWAKGSKKIPQQHEYDPNEYSYEAAVIWPTAASQQPAANLIREIIRSKFDNNSSREDIGKIMIRQKNDVLNAVKKDDVQTCELNTTVRLEYRNARLLTLCTSKYVYNIGAAHGYNSNSYSCIDLINNRKLDITDVLDTLAGRRLLQTLMQQKFRKLYNVEASEKISAYLFSDSIPLSNNFLLTTKGIGFNYNPYAIGPYAMGIIFIYIPFEEINAYLKPEFKQLIAAP